jgi:O6-methylguanine-DNA--protein-cysteine methyltransferase
MKKVLICSVAAIAILLAGSMALAKEKDRSKVKNKENARETKKLSEQDKQWREKFKEMTPEQKRVALAQKDSDAELAPWRQVRKIAAGENATKTVAAIDKIIADKQTQFKKKLATLKEKKPVKSDKTKDEGSRREGRKAGREKAVNEE